MKQWLLTDQKSISCGFDWTASQLSFSGDFVPRSRSMTTRGHFVGFPMGSVRSSQGLLTHPRSLFHYRGPRASPPQALNRYRSQRWSPEYIGRTIRQGQKPRIYLDIKWYNVYIVCAIESGRPCILKMSSTVNTGSAINVRNSNKM